MSNEFRKYLFFCHIPQNITTMSGRGGTPIKLIIYALFIVGVMYLIYINNSANTRLREAEMTAERYRRGEESKVAELQGIVLMRILLFYFIHVATSLLNK